MTAYAMLVIENKNVHVRQKRENGYEKYGFYSKAVIFVIFFHVKSTSVYVALT